VTAWLLDLDGVVCVGDEVIPGVPAAVDRLRRAGLDVSYVTNNASRTVGEQEARLGAMGLDAAGRVVTAAQAGASLVERGERVFVIGGAGVHEELDRRGALVVGAGERVDAVVVGLDHTFDYAALAAANHAIRHGARFILCNDDPSFPGPTGMEPGAGSIAAAIATASEVQPTIAGKPHPPMAALVQHRLGPDGVLAGDRLSTDGAFARALGYRFGLVLTGATTAAEAAGADADWITPDLPALVDRVLTP
jgi:glycerol 3-phosphatase-2